MPSTVASTTLSTAWKYADITFEVAPRQASRHSGSAFSEARATRSGSSPQNTAQMGAANTMNSAEIAAMATAVSATATRMSVFRRSARLAP